MPQKHTYYVVVDCDQQTYASDTLKAAVAVCMPDALSDVLHAFLVEASDPCAARLGFGQRLATVSPNVLSHEVIEYLADCALDSWP